MVNYISKSALNTRIFRLVCQELNSNHKDLFYYTAVRWLSKGNVIARVFELMDELKIYFKSQGKSAEYPFIIIMDYIPEEMENEFLSLINNTSLKNVFK